jgi:hypothetical protein
MLLMSLKHVLHVLYYGVKHARKKMVLYIHIVGTVFFDVHKVVIVRVNVVLKLQVFCMLVH